LLILILIVIINYILTHMWNFLILRFTYLNALGCQLGGSGPAVIDVAVVGATGTS
jgi:hypothetical protein